MRRQSDHTGVPYTCPLIDQVTTALIMVEDIIESDHYIAILEQIREHNSTLRSIANEKSEERDEFENDLDKANNEIEYLKDEVGDLKNEISNLEDEIESLKDQLGELQEMI